MRRTTLPLLLLLAAALPALAQDASEDGKKGPMLVESDALKVKADDLRDAVASPRIDDFAVHNRAGGLFENVQSETPLVRPKPRFMDRERVDGHIGTIDGMLQTAKERYDHYRMKTAEVPAADLEKAVVYSKTLRDQKRAEFDRTGKMAENQMGEFVYAVKDRMDAGKVEINGRMALIATRIGEAFSYATLVHESAHAKARAEGRLDPEHVIDGEVEAYRVQYRWLKVVDPSAERMIVLHSTLNLYLQRHPEDQVTRASIAYVEHLLQLWDTGGEDGKLREMIKRLGYEEKDGINPEAAATAGPRV